MQAETARMLAVAGIEINGPNPWDIQVNDPRLYRRIFRHGSLALGESYMDGWWDCEQLDEFIARVLRHRVDQSVPKNLRTIAYRLSGVLLNRQSKARAWIVGREHYDLGNDVFEATFDTRITGSCGYWARAENLDDSQTAKLDLICRKIGLQSGQHVLDIGCGWGSFMQFAAAEYGARCTGVTVSENQVELGRQRCADLPVEFRLQDYRDLQGNFDHVVSMGMFEHVGVKNYPIYFDVARRCLKDEGFFLLHSIGANRTSPVVDPWIDKYIFPNGALPSIRNLGEALEGRFVVEDWHNFGPDYDLTLCAWMEKFDSNWDSLKQKYGERFYRMWRYYLLSCAGGFRARNIHLWQLVLSKRGATGGYVPVR